MKKYIFPVVSVFFLTLFSSPVLAAVNISATDTSTSTVKQIALAVDTETDTLTSLSVGIQASSDVTITEVAKGTSTSCTNFTYTNQNNLVTVNCTMTTAQAVSGNIANITFTSTSSAYKFTIVQDSTLDIGQLTLGTVTNVDASTTDTTTTATDTTTQTTTTATTTTTTTKTLKDQIMDYLPYVLIGGAVILLVSIVGILLSKKKTPEDSNEKVTIPTPEPTPTPVTENTPASNPINMDSISNTLYTPSVSTPTIQDALSSTTPSPVDSVLNSEQPAFEPTTVNVPDKDQSSDLQAILHQESQSDSGPTVQTPVTPEPMQSDTTVSTPIETPSDVPQAQNDLQNIMPDVNTPVESTATPEIDTTAQPSFTPDSNMNNTMVPEQPVEELKPIDTTPAQEIPSTPIPDLQQFINTQVSQVPPAAPEAPVTGTPDNTMNSAPMDTSAPTTQYGV